jgi:hypothetical protein
MGIACVGFISLHPVTEEANAVFKWFYDNNSWQWVFLLKDRNTSPYPQLMSQGQ